MREEELKTGSRYRGKTGNTFILFRDYEPNVKCFQRQDGYTHYGREFIEYREGKRVIDLEPNRG
jgi:hypothetical protein